MYLDRITPQRNNMYMIRTTLALLVLLIVCPAFAQNNLALNKPYTWNTKPNYTFTIDDGDATQLTDGQYTEGRFWVERSTVGWMHTSAGRVVITIDLGEVQSIGGFSINSAAGNSGVHWPAYIHVLVSDDNAHYRAVTDLAQTSPPPAGGYAVHRYEAHDIRARGRYVTFVIIPDGIFAFADEIEIYAGNGEPPARATIDDLDAYMDGIVIHAAVRKRLAADLAAVREAAKERRALTSELDSIAAAIDALPLIENPRSFRAVFPLNDIHARIFAMYGELARSKTVTAWTCNRYDYIEPQATAAPARAARKLSVAAMRGETRSAVINLANATTQATRAAVRIEGLPNTAIELRQVEWTDTADLASTLTADAQKQWDGPTSPAPIASALVDMPDNTTTLPAGMTRQVWINVTPLADAPAGEHRATVIIEPQDGDRIDMPLTLRVFDVTYPEQSALHVGGWDYTNGGGLYGVTAQNQQPLIDMISAFGVDTPWGSSSVLGFGAFDAQGNMTTPPDTSQFDQWIERWSQARRYAVFLHAQPQIGDHPRTTEAFNRAVGQWITFWVDHARSKGIDPQRLIVLIVDEPRKPEDDQLTIDWAVPIRAANTGVTIWCDPVYFDPNEALPGLWEVVDTICPLRGRLVKGGPEALAFYKRQNRTLELYNCSGPSTRLDPYSYYRLQAWHAFDIGAVATHFWAFGSVGRGGSWNEYLNTVVTYTPLFIAPDSVTPAKPMMAIRESVQDYQYLVMLRDRAGSSRQVDAICDRVLAAPGAQIDSPAVNISWHGPRDRSVADQAIVEIGSMIEQLSRD
jgi:hypothetical protein